MKWQHLLVASLLSSIALPTSAQQVYPERPIRLVVAFPPGGSVDAIARDIGRRFSARWSHPAVVDNRPGANGNIGAEIVAKARPDGHTILISTANLAISPTLYKNLGYDVFRDLAPVTMLATGPYILITPTSFPVRSVGELISLARAKPNQIALASTDIGSPGHLAGELLQAATRIKFTHVPYKGQAPALVDLIGGQVTVLFASAVAAYPQLKAGRVKALAVTTERRASLVPDVPTIAESGVRGFNVGAWHAAFVTAKTPPEIIAKLHDELVQFVRAPDMKTTYTQQGLELVSSSPEQLAKILRSEVALYEKVTRNINVQMD
jgi:tripartite-type tricarboxylate transporter receptor subunit TctC